MNTTTMRNRNHHGTPTRGQADHRFLGECSDDSKIGKKKRPSVMALGLWVSLGFLLMMLFSVVMPGHVTSNNDRNHRRRRQKVRSLEVNLVKRPHYDSSNRNNRKMTKCPDEFKKNFFVDEDKKINQPPIRALRMRGWRKTDKYSEAQVIWTYAGKSSWYDELQPWQRYNHIPHYKEWNRKDSFVSHMMNYSATSGKEIVALPETYRLDDEGGVAQFKKRLFEEGGIDTPWVLKMPDVNQGKGIAMLGPRSSELTSRVFEIIKEDEGEQTYIIQRYVCNEMTIRNRKFDFRVFWIVASLDPLIVMYHDGYLRIGNSEYNENDFSNTEAHLTTHTGLAEEGKGTWTEFAEYVAEVNKTHGLKLQDPIGHVQNQVKQVLGEMAAAFKDVTFNTDFLSAENGFAFYCADFIIDLDLDVYFIEPQHGCGLDEDHQFRVEMHNALFTQMIDATEEIWERQEKGLPLENKDLINHGEYEIVYNDGWMYEYDGYQRSKNKRGCDLARTAK